MVGSSPVGHAKAREVGYTYDGLHRVVRADYAQPAAVSTAFNYDLLGNRKTVDDGLNGVYRKYYGEQGALGANNVNEYLDVSVGPDAGSQVSQGFLYDEDRRGNLVRDDGFDDNPNDAFLYSYDPENRLTKVEYDDGTNPVVTMAEYRYDALGRRIEYKRYDTGGALVETIRYYHDGQNVIAEYVVDGGGAENQARSFVNGSQYIDERIVMRDHVSRKDHYYLHQELYSAAGLASANGVLEEAYVYDTYGDAHIWQWPVGDFDRDGDVDSTDQTTLTSNYASPTVKPWLDLDSDGDADSADLAVMTVVSAPTELASSAAGNPYLFTGKPTDTLSSSMYGSTIEHIRIHFAPERVYCPKHGIWLMRDSAGYVDSPNLHEYARSTPTVLVDPTGFASEKVFQNDDVLFSGSLAMKAWVGTNKRGGLFDFWTANEFDIQYNYMKKISMQAGIGLIPTVNNTYEYDVPEIDLEPYSSDVKIPPISVSLAIELKDDLGSPLHRLARSYVEARFNGSLKVKPKCHCIRGNVFFSASGNMTLGIKEKKGWITRSGSATVEESVGFDNCNLPIRSVGDVNLSTGRDDSFGPDNLGSAGNALLETFGLRIHSGSAKYNLRIEGTLFEDAAPDW